ncbi:hypothetical protein T459_13703 [Capsicum annuum]|uniref:Uncharacterized protein n=1 Tax=Capsicum annuum TaxID=4072 RepID=A0A2G2ZFD0_CAPAN|nr:hypothetical protein T459_13703 [Capsicum annuum]
MIFPLFWNHGNATTPRKLGARHSAVTSLTNTNKVNRHGSAGQYYLVSETPYILGARGSAVTRLSDTKEVASDDQSGRQYFTISKSSSHDDRANVETPRILGARHNSVTSLPDTKEVDSNEPGNRYFASDEPGNRYLASNEPGNRYLASDEPGNRYLASDEPGNRYLASDKLGNLYLAFDELENRYIAFDEPGKRNLASDEPENRYFTISKSGELGHRYESPIAHKFSSSQMWQPAVHEFEVTPRKLWASRHNGVISLSNTDEATSGGSEHQYSSILTSSAHTHRVLQTRSSGATSLSNTNKIAFFIFHMFAVEAFDSQK